MFFLNDLAAIAQCRGFFDRVRGQPLFMFHVLNIFTIYVIIITPMAHGISLEKSALKSCLHQVGLALQKFSSVSYSAAERRDAGMFVMTH